jgi:hypothetical protein
LKVPQGLGKASELCSGAPQVGWLGFKLQGDMHNRPLLGSIIPTPLHISFCVPPPKGARVLVG